jgi:hypothetical protein
MSQTHSARHPPFLVNLAAILAFLLGGAQVLFSLTDFFRSAFDALPPIAGGWNVVWGLVDLLFGLALIYAGYALLQWRSVGRAIALLVVVLLAFRWANFVVLYQWQATGLIVLCVAIIAALAWSDDPAVDG